MPKVEKGSLVKWHGSPLSPLHLLTAYPTSTVSNNGFEAVIDGSGPCIAMISKKLGDTLRFQSKHLPTDHVCWKERTAIRFEVKHRLHGGDDMDIRLLPRYKKDADQMLLTALGSGCRIEILVGNRNLRTFKKTEHYRKGVKFPFPGPPLFSGERNHGCVVMQGDRVQKIVFWVLYPEVLVNPIQTDELVVNDMIFNTAIALSGLDLSAKKRYWEFHYKPEPLSGDALDDVTALDDALAQVAIEETTGEHLDISNLPASIHGWLSRNPDFHLHSAARQIQGEMARKGRRTVARNVQKRAEEWRVNQAGVEVPTYVAQITSTGYTEYIHIKLGIPKKTYKRYVAVGTMEEYQYSD
jgi:hypothetical protein